MALFVWGNGMLTFIFVDYFSASSTIKCIQHFIEKCEKSQEKISFVIVDNSVDDANFNELSKAYSTISTMEFDGSLLEEKRIGDKPCFLWKNKENTGYAQGNNAAAKVAITYLKSDYFIFSNNDLLVLDSILDIDRLIQELKHNQVAIVGPSIVAKDGKIQNPYYEKSFLSRWILEYLFYPFSRFLPKKCSSGDLLDPFLGNPVFRVMGSFFLIPSAVFIEVNGFDDNTFLFAEELILAKKMQQINYKINFVSEVHLLHNHSEIINKKYDFSKRLLLRFKSEAYYYKHYVGVSSGMIFIAELILKSYLFRKRIVQQIKSFIK